MANKGWRLWFQKEARLYVSLWENDPVLSLIYYLNNQFLNQYMIASH